MFVPGMQLAGAMMITSGIASSGLIGGSVGKFLTSGLGQGLMAAVSLGSTAYAMFGSSILNDSLTAAQNAEAMGQAEALGSAQAAASATSDAAQQVTSDLAAAGGSDLIPTGASISGTAGVNTSNFVSAASAGVGGTTPQALGTAQSVVDPLNPEANLAMTQSNQAAQAAVNPGANAAVDPSAAGGGSASIGPKAPGAQVYSGAEGGAPTGASAPPPGASAPTAGAAAPGAANAGAAAAPGAAPGAAPASGSGGFLDKASKFLDTKGGAAAVQGVGSMLGGIGQGMEQKSAMEDQIRAQQWAGRTYMDPQAQAQLAGAAASPITVPSGYLQRAQALRSMLNNSAVTGAGAPPAPVPFRG